MKKSLKIPERKQLEIPIVAHARAFGFTIPAEDGGFINPLGYTRTTQNSKWNEKYRLYVEWCDWVAKCFLEAANNSVRVEKGERCFIRTMTYFKNDRRSDASNVHKGIEDALADNHYERRLYENDKYASGCFDFGFDPDNPRVEVTIYY